MFRQDCSSGPLGVMWPGGAPRQKTRPARSPCRRQRRVDGSAGDRPMAEPSGWSGLLDLVRAPLVRGAGSHAGPTYCCRNLPIASPHEQCTRGLACTGTICGLVGRAAISRTSLLRVASLNCSRSLIAMTKDPGPFKKRMSPDRDWVMQSLVVDRSFRHALRRMDGQRFPHPTRARMLRPGLIPTAVVAYSRH
jgi:hypothetical protein